MTLSMRSISHHDISESPGCPLLDPFLRISPYCTLDINGELLTLFLSGHCKLNDELSCVYAL